MFEREETCYTWPRRKAYLIFVSDRHCHTFLPNDAQHICPFHFTVWVSAKVSYICSIWLNLSHDLITTTNADGSSTKSGRYWQVQKVVKLCRLLATRAIIGLFLVAQNYTQSKLSLKVDTQKENNLLKYFKDHISTLAKVKINSGLSIGSMIAYNFIN